MSYSNYDAFFAAAHGDATMAPFPYQARLADAPELPQLLNVPTGLGKTAAVVLGWLWRRRFATEDIRKATPRRLVYCLPMRVLVEQTVNSAQEWLQNLDLDSDTDAGVNVHAMIGGDFNDDWDLYPERDAILVGTQDMLLSRALNRGYGSSRYRWPTQFGLLNSDTLWIFDETQLMGVGVKTSAQLQAFRHRAGTMMRAHSIWMSATLNDSALETVDTRLQMPQPWRRLTLESDDHGDEKVEGRLTAAKRLEKTDLTLTADSRKDYSKELAKLVLDVSSKRGGQTIVVLNRVDRAQETYRALKKLCPDAASL